MADELFSKLNGCSWRGISFPLVSLSTSVQQDLVQHKYPGVDGANVESTGRAPLEFHARIPFRNGIVAGPNEDWGVFPLYPNTFRAFLAAMANGATGELVHPALGSVQCKAMRAEAVLNGERRDGMDVDASWVETTDASDRNATLFSEAPAAVAKTAAATLDANNAITKDQFAALLARAGAGLPAYEPTFADSMRQITSVTDQAGLLSRRAFGRIDAVAYRVNTLGDSVDRMNSSLMWPLAQDVNRVRAAIADLKRYIATSGKAIQFYVVQADTTLANVARMTGASIDTLAKLNPLAVAEAVLKSGTIVRYYL
jgi:prophage DNA circulation protein